MNTKQVIGLIIRYAIIVFLAFPNLLIIYSIFTPLTVYSAFFVLSKIYGPEIFLSASKIIFRQFSIEIIPACVAGAAYYLILILNLTTPMKARTRLYSLVFLLGTFFLANLIRIVVLSSFILSEFAYFDFAHKLTWYLGSTLLVVIIWFANVYIFKIKTIPVYTDIKNIYRQIYNKKNK